jgi:tetratricopeptide (TPR) repeat protein
MTTSAQTLALAWRAYQTGAMAESATLFREALRDDPGNADAWCMLGIVSRALGQPDAAVSAYQEALRLRPDFVEALNNLGNALVNQNKAGEAIAAFEQVLRLRPGYAEAHNNLAAALRQQGKWADAEAQYREAIRLKPDYTDAHNNLGVALQGLGRLEEAEASYHNALRLRPDYAEAHTNLGTALIRLGRLDEATAHHREALRLRPDYAEAHSNLGNALVAGRRYAEAEACYREALRLKRDYAEGHHNLGTALAEQGHLDEAIGCYREALRLRPDYSEACGNLATALLAQGKPEEALAVHEPILQRKPDSADAHMWRALARLLMGDWERGWEDYERRWGCEEFGGLPYEKPQWDGSPLTGRTILLHAEQGLGDTLLFVRYAKLVKERGGKVVLVCPKALVRLLAGCPGVDELVAQGSPVPPHDSHAPLLSLPRLFHTTPANAPADVPYLVADPARVDRWRRELTPYSGFKIGIAWQGNPQYKGDRLRSFPVKLLEPVARVEGVLFFSLQKGHGSEQLRGINFPVVDLASRLDETSGPFLDTAAVLPNLDLVIAADTSIAHLAGALGVPVWLPLALSPHWVWLLDREDSPWYPTVRLFRQRRWGDWPEVMERLAAELRRKSLGQARQPKSGSILIEIAPGELLDKITILQIKSERIRDPMKLRNVRHELTVLEAAQQQATAPSAELQQLTASLKEVNEALWQIEDEIRLCERDQDFGPRFIELARSVYRQNDRRAALKRRINDLLGSALKEEKAFTVDTVPPARGADGASQSTAGSLADALRLHQAGNLAEADRLYRQVLRDEPENASALHLLGLVAQQSGRHADAAEHIERAARLRPDDAEIFSNLGTVRAAQRRPHDAVACFCRAVELAPDFVAARANLGNAFIQLGQPAQAEECFREVLRRQPDSADAHANLGVALTEQGRLDDALECLQRALHRRPDLATGHYHMGLTLGRLGKWDAAAECYAQAVRLQPDHADAHNNLGGALEKLGRVDEAVVCYGRALQIRPDYAEAHNNRAAALTLLAQLEAALAAYDQAVSLRPDFAEARHSRAMIHLARGDYERGWPELEWRLRCPGDAPPAFAKPRWDGSPLQGRTILLYAEQGLGDTIQFVRYAPLVKERGGTVILASQAALIRLLTGCPGVDQVVGRDGPLPEFDVHAPLLSLPGIFGTTAATVPAPVPYLSANPHLVAHWRRELTACAGSGRRVAIVWQGNPRYQADHWRSAPLKAFAPLARLPGVQLFSLQKGPGVEQLRDFPATELGSRLDVDAGPFMDTAAVLKNLDLLISVDTATAHLAGALGVAVWLALSFAPHWVWMRGRVDSPWYPTARLFRQSQPGVWDDVFERMAAELRNR